jgi:IS605 OrfB family transposase
VTGPSHYALLAYQHGETDLMYRKGEFYLCTTCEVPEDVPIDPEGWLGVDLGIANIATDNDGEKYSGSHVKHVRHRNRRLRARLQSKGTKSAKRKLKRLSGREARFAKDVNHTISKRLVAKAQDTARGIALENLTHIRSRITVQRAQRATLHSWSFFQLRAFITYKAQRGRVAVALVDPKNTSRQCAVCGHIDKANRPKQDVFLCTSCGHAAHADVNAAVNIGRRAAVNPPNAVGDLGSDPA